MSDKLFTYSVVLKQNKELSFFANKYDIDDGVLTFYRGDNLIASFNNNLWETCYLLDSENLQPIILSNLNSQLNEEENDDSDYSGKNNLKPQLTSHENIDNQSRDKVNSKNNLNEQYDNETVELDNSINTNFESVIKSSLGENKEVEKNTDLVENVVPNQIKHEIEESFLSNQIEDKSSSDTIKDEQKNQDLISSEKSTKEKNNISNNENLAEEEFEEELVINTEDYFANLDESFKADVMKQYASKPLNTSENETLEKTSTEIFIKEAQSTSNVSDDELLDLNDFELVDFEEVDATESNFNNLNSTIEDSIKDDSHTNDNEVQLIDLDTNPFNELDSLDNELDIIDNSSSADENLKDKEEQTTTVYEEMVEVVSENIPALEEDPFEILDSFGEQETASTEEESLVSNNPDPYTMLDDIINEDNPESNINEKVEVEVKTKEFSIDENANEDALIEQENDRVTSDIDSIEELLSQLPDSPGDSVYAHHFEQGSSEIRRVKSSNLNKDFDAMDSLLEKETKETSKEPKKSILEKVVNTVEKIAKIDKKFGTPASHKQEITKEFSDEPEAQTIEKLKENPMIRNSQGRLLTPQELKIKKDKIIEKTVLQYCTKYDSFNANNLYKLLSKNTTAQPYGITENDIIWVATKMIKNYEINVEKFSSADIQNRLNFFLPNLMTLHWDGSMGNMYSVIKEIPQLKDIILIDVAVWLVNNNY